MIRWMRKTLPLLADDKYAQQPAAYFAATRAALPAL